MEQSPKPKLRPKLKLSYDDLKKIERVVEAEAKGEGVEGRNAIRGVIFNRLMSKRFPNTVDEVLSPREFEPVGTYGSVDKIPVNEDTLNERLTEMADYIQLGEDASKGSTFFLNKKLAKKRKTDFGGKDGMTIGNHTFYKSYEGQEPVEDVNFSHNIEVYYAGYDQGGFVDSLMDTITSPLTGEYRKEKPLSVKAADTAVSLTTPIDSIVEIKEELKKDEPDYLKIGMLGGVEAISLIPGIAPAARTMIRKGADMARQTDEAINVASSVPKVSRQPFNKTRPAYKLFVRAEDEKLYPLFVNASDEIPVNQWLEADFPDIAFKGKTKAGGEGWYVPTKGAKRSKGEKSKKTGDTITIPDEETRQKLIDAGFITEKTGRTKDAPYGRVTAVAARPGFHASVNPVAEHLGPQDIKVSKAEADKLVESGINPKAIRRRGNQYYVKRRAEDQYWAEVDMADDTSDELRAYMESQGRSDINDKVPKGGSYSYVDGQADGDTWVVGGDMKVKRVLTREEAKAAQEAAGVKDLPYRDEVEEILGRKFADGGLVGEDMYTGQQDYLLASSSGMEMNEGGVATDEQMNAVFKSTRGYALGGDVEIDPVSGNEVPPGSLPEEVRDDIPAMLSEGEYVVPADVLRFYGVKFFEDLRAQAKMGLAEMEANGRIGGEPIEEETGDVGISDEDLMAIMAQAPQEEQTVGAANGGLMGFQQGGLNYPAYIQQPDLTQFGMAGPDFQGGLEYRTFTNDAGMTITIPFFNGEPMGMIPPGYTEGEAPKAEEAAPESQDEGEPVRARAPAPEEFDLDAIPTEKLEETARGMSTMTNIASGIASMAGLPVAALVNTTGVARYNDVLDRLQAEDPEAFEKSGLTKKGSIFGGESSLYENLADTDGDGKKSFGDTWLGDFLGFDGEAGIAEGNPGLRASIAGERRTGDDDTPVASTPTPKAEPKEENNKEPSGSSVQAAAESYSDLAEAEDEKYGLI